MFNLKVKRPMYSIYNGLEIIIETVDKRALEMRRLSLKMILNEPLNESVKNEKKINETSFH